MHLQLVPPVHKICTVDATDLASLAARFITCALDLLGLTLLVEQFISLSVIFLCSGHITTFQVKGVGLPKRVTGKTRKSCVICKQTVSRTVVHA